MSVSSDGVLTTTVDTTTNSVKVVVDFTAAGFGGLPAGTVNILPNPSSELAPALNGALLNVTLAQSATQKRSGTFSTRMTAPAAGAMQATGPNFPVTPGQPYVVSAYARAAVTGRVVTVGLAFYTAVGGFISILGAGTATDNAAGFTRAQSPVTAPAGAFLAAVYVQVAAAAAAEIHYIDDIQVEEGTAATAYAEGGQVGVVWQGAAHNSPSVRPPFQWVTVYHTGGGAVRGMSNALAPGGILPGYDTEIGLTASTEYVATITNGIATLQSAVAPGVFVFATPNKAWIKSIYTPALSVGALPERGGYPNWEMGIVSGVFRRLAGRFPSTAQGDRQEPTGTFTVITRTRAEQVALEALLRSPGPYLIHFSPESVEPDRYVIIDTTGPQRYTGLAVDQERRWELPLVVVDRPPTAGSYTTPPGKTYDADTALVGTWAGDTALAQTYLAWVTP